MKFEKEVKILDINVEDEINKLNKIGAEFIGKKEQKIYVYDVPTLYYRYLEICSLLKSDNKLMVNTNLKKLEILLNEFVDLITESELSELLEKLELYSIDDLLKLPIESLLSKIESEPFRNLMVTEMINPNKWIRLRESNGKCELTTKHVLEKKKMDVQAVIEREINTSSFEETNNILESLGIVKRSYQEKIRYSFKIEGADIEIDIWPMLKPYMEIEAKDTEIIKEIIDKLNLSNNEIVSMNTQQLYKKIGINLEEVSELKFNGEG